MELTSIPLAEVRFRLAAGTICWRSGGRLKCRSANCTHTFQCFSSILPLALISSPRRTLPQKREISRNQHSEAALALHSHRAATPTTAPTAPECWLCPFYPSEQREDTPSVTCWEQGLLQSTPSDLGVMNRINMAKPLTRHHFPAAQPQPLID